MSCTASMRWTKSMTSGMPNYSAKLSGQRTRKMYIRCMQNVTIYSQHWNMHWKKCLRLEAYPCWVCLQNYTDNETSTCCDACQMWMHAYCIRMSDVVLQSYTDADVSFLCWACTWESGRDQRQHSWLHGIACLQSIPRISLALPDVFSITAPFVISKHLRYVSFFVKLLITFS